MLSKQARAAIAVTLFVALTLLALALWRPTEPSAVVAPTQPSASISVSEPDPELLQPTPPIAATDGRSLDSETQPAPELAPRDPRPVNPNLLKGHPEMIRNVQNDIVQLRKLKLYGTGNRVVSRGMCLYEDLRGKSFDLDKGVPKEMLNKYDTYTYFNGPAGARFYTFPREEYPLFWEMMNRNEQGYEDKLPDELVERIIAFTEGAIELAGPLPE